MRNILKSILQKLLKLISQKIIKRYKPKIIAITGSYGKTSTKEAIYTVISASLRTEGEAISGDRGIATLPPPFTKDGVARNDIKEIRKNKGNLNSQWGLPLTIISAPDPHGSFLKWFRIVLKGLAQIIKTNKTYPEILILEMGADKPGDISYLLEIAKPHVAVLTGIGPTHLEYFDTVAQVTEEKLKLIKSLSQDGVAIFNIDNPLIEKFISKPEVHYLTYGTKLEAQVMGSEVNLELINLAIESSTALSVEHIGGVGFKIIYQNQNYQCYLPNVVGLSHVYSALAAMAVGIGLGIDPTQTIEALKDYQAVPGRLRLLKGIKNTILIDDTYNSSPETAELALETLSSLAVQSKRWAVLGDMLELGKSTESLHQNVGKRLAELNIDYLITIGSLAHNIAHGAVNSGQVKDTVFEFDKSQEAGRFLQDRISKGDLILVKGSRGVHLEAVVKEIMAEPQKAGELLVY